ETLDALPIRARTRFQPGAADRLARNDDRAQPLGALLSCVSLTQARRNGGRYLRLWVAVRGALDPLVRLQDPGLDVPLGLRVQAFQELRLHPGGHLHDANPGAGGRPLLFQDRPECLEVPVRLRAVLGTQLDRDADLLEPDREERPQSIEDVLHLRLDTLEGVDVDPRLFHGDLAPLGRM